MVFFLFFLIFSDFSKGSIVFKGFCYGLFTVGNLIFIPDILLDFYIVKLADRDGGLLLLLLLCKGG